MDLRFHEGGKEGDILTPGSTVIAKMEFFGMDVLIPAGDISAGIRVTAVEEFFGMDVVIPENDGIQLIITQTGEDYVPSPVSTMPVSLGMGSQSVLSLSTISRDCNDLFLPPMHSDYPQCTAEE